MSLFTVFGNPIAHSLSPAIHQCFAEQAGLSLSYTRSLVAPHRFARSVAQFFRQGGAGANVTVPFKQQAYQLATHVTERAALAGAVNTLLPLSCGQLLGDNTDGMGLVQDLSRHLKLDLQQCELVIIGAGGAVRGALQPLLDAGVQRILIANRSLAKAEELAQSYRPQPVHAVALEQLQVPSQAVVINATSLSLFDQPLPIEPQQLEKASCAYDMVYAAQPTAFMRQATAAGVPQVEDGLGMLVEQAAIAFKLWHDLDDLNTEAVRTEIRARLIA